MNPIDQIRKALGFEVTSDTPRILEWADQAGCCPATDSECALWDALHAAVQRAAEMERERDQKDFALEALRGYDKAVVADLAAERERCALACEALAIHGGDDCAAAIRAIKE